MYRKIFFSIFLILCVSSTVFSQNPPSNLSEKRDSLPNLDDILKGVETRYLSTTDFTAQFFQKSTIKAMDITDHASGILQIKRPGMMRWEYEIPEKQIIITDGKDLWIYRPDDKQVMVGKAPSYFGGGKGAGFLSDIKLIRNDFSVTLESINDPDSYVLKLVPNEKKFDIAMIHLYVSKKTYDISKVISFNSAGDETYIEFDKFQFNRNPDDSLFRFTIPEGTDILQLED